MNDENTGGLTPHREVDIPARFVKQAQEFLQHSRERYVTFLFTGEQLADAVCIGIMTGRRPLIIEQRATSAPQPTRAPQPTQAAPQPTTWTLQSLTEEVILNLIRANHPIGTRHIGDTLGIASNNVPLRQRIRRILAALTGQGLIHRNNDNHFPSYSPTVNAEPAQPSQPRMKVRAARKIRRRDITEERVVAILREGPASSRTIGDRLGVPRPDNSVRSKITEIMGRLRAVNQVRPLDLIQGKDGGRMYEMVTAEEEEEAA